MGGRQEADVLKAVGSLPINAVKDLVSLGVCHRCILSLFGCYDCICSSPSIPTSALARAFNQVLPQGDYADQVCSVCLGILQFAYMDNNGVFVKNESASELAATIITDHQLDTFALQVSIPPLVLDNQKAVWLYIKTKWSSQLEFLELSKSTKDVFKMAITNTLETSLGVKSTETSFQIRLTYTLAHTSASTQDTSDTNGFSKRRKTGNVEGIRTVQSCTAAGEASADGLKKYIDSEAVSNELQVQGINNFKIPLEKVNQPCCLTYLCYRNPIFIGGRYLKFSRNVSQSRWIIDDERMGEASVEEIIGNIVLPMSKGDTYKFHAAGREDIDVRMLGTGRPFLIEIQNARQVPSSVFMKQVEMRINNLESKRIKVKDLKCLGSNGWDLMREGEAEKQKQYAALVWISRPINDNDLHAIVSLKDMKIMQKTPVRVLHRRSPLGREKIIHWMRVEKIAGSTQYFLLHLCTQAGTYIKEFVHGDLGRTHPSIGSILGCRAEILQLDVTDVKMDCFQDEPL
ncbi:hypothetical protein LIER_22016 [Lithospermum erythrorhizon]|uniref:tRNA pseudouridine(55) synthase n=1 Tax=Lithospermum erythrorhizon TaxID=34254 RepID=A0AAV3QUS4_LITER